MMPGSRAVRFIFCRYWLLVMVLSAPHQANASCALAAELATLHGAYSDLIEGRGTPREDIGRFVIARELGDETASDLSQTLNSSGFYDTMDELEPVLDDMARLAERGPAAEDLSQHRANIEGLNSTLRGTGCFEEPGTTETNAPATPPDPSTETDATEAETDPETLDLGRPSLVKRVTQLISETAPISYVILACGLAVLGVLGLAGWRILKNTRARAFARIPFGGSLPITDGTGQRKDRVVVDISRGGLMIERPAVIDPGPYKRVVVHLPDGEFALKLAWDNTHFFGYQFDKPIDEDVLKNVLALDVGPSASNETGPEVPTASSPDEPPATTSEAMA